MPLFFRSRSPSISPAEPSPAIPAGERIYAIGDIHGCLDELQLLLQQIDADHAARPSARRTLIFLGDLIDRGPASAQVVALVEHLVTSGEARLLKGNHEELFLRAASGDRQSTRVFMSVGGQSTLASYGLDDEEVGRGSFTDLAALMQQRIPEHVLTFLDGGEDKIVIGDYLFVHAGIRPGVGIAAQVPADLRWIRREFLESRASHGAVVVHGHTISEAVEECGNRIGIDTGAFATGILTAIGLEGEERWFLSTADRESGRPTAAG